MELKDFYYCSIRPGTKRPKHRAWQKFPLGYQSAKELPAYGILTGRGGFLAIDCDGIGAITRLQELFGGWIPDTWAWSSGKEGRVQFGFLVPESQRSRLTSARYWENLPDGSQLDFRWLGCQSVLPPSAHPETGAYIWEQSPADFPLAVAPEWLIDYAVSLKNRNKFQLKVRIPARVYSYYGPSMKIWAYAQLMAKGSGRAELSFKKCAGDLKRSVSSIRRLLTQAYRQNLLRNFSTRGDQCVAYPTAMLKIVSQTGWPTLGEVTEVCLDDIEKLRNLNILCTEAIACSLQAASLFAAKKEPPSVSTSVLNPFNPADPGKRVLWRGQRYAAVSERVVTCGVSQKKIASIRNVCQKTIGRHLSNVYRQSPSPVRGERADLKPIEKVQILQRIPRGLDSAMLELDIGRSLKCGSRLYSCCTNIYGFDRSLSLRVRWHRRTYKAMAKTTNQGKKDIFDNIVMTKAQILAIK